MKRATRVATLAMLSLCAPVRAYDVTDEFSINGVLASVLQCQEVSDSGEDDDKCRGAISFQPEMSFRVTDADEFFARFGFGDGNGLNVQPPFVLAPWAASLEDDVKDINGRNRDYLLTAWYRHTFTLAEHNTLAPTLGIIDATDYLDENAYSNDEYTQFMNEALVNGPQAFLPSYDAGAAVEWESRAWTVRGVVMNIGDNDDGNGYNFYGAQVGYTVDAALGKGNYRVLIDGTNQRFLNPSGSDEERRLALLLSFDQQLGHVLGAWIRFGWQTDDAAVDHDALYSGGLDIRGNPWRRGEDNIGVGYAYLSGGNLDIDASHVAEAYYRFVLNDYFALTADVQYMKDDYDSRNDDPKGWIFGVRAAAGF